MRFAVTVFTLAVVVGCVKGIYLPGVAPHEYADGDKVDVKVNKLTSTRSALSFDYYDLPVCRPKGGVRPAAENLGEHLTGDDILNTPYKAFMNVNSTCQVICHTPALTHAQLLMLSLRVRSEYYINMIVDNLPAATTGLTADGSVLYSRGFPIGGTNSEDAYYVFNHLRITLKYHQSSDYEGKRIVGFDVHPMSVKHKITGEGAAAKIDGCVAETGIDPAATHEALFFQGTSDRLPVRIPYTADVFWVKSDTRWASRWDIYLSMGDRYSPEIHWFSIINSTIIALFLTGLVAMIMVRALYRDFSRYNRVATDEEKAEDKEETGWKLVHADVFRPPSSHPMLFSVLVGVGNQVLGMAATTLAFAAIGFLSPANRGSLMVSLVILFMLYGVGAGYTAARTHKALNGVSYQRCTLLVGFGFPGLLFSVLFVLNLFVWRAGSVNAVSFGSMFAVLALWLIVSVPLVFVGAYYGFRAEKMEFPVRTAAIPRPIPPTPWYMSTPVVLGVGGVLPFGAVFVELFFILTSLWLDQYYYVFGFLLLVFGIVLLTSAEISIVLTYFQLCAEDYNWWWRSFATPGAAGVYLFLYSIVFYSTRLNLVDSTSTILYFGYSFLLSALFALLCGVMGHLATFWFLRKIYGAIKVD